MDISTARDLLASRRQLERRGVTARDLAARVGRGELVRLDHSCYMDASSWSGLYSEGRHLMRVLAAEQRSSGRSSLVFSHTSAAVLWGLPLFRVEPARVHVSGSAASGHVSASRPLVARHDVAVSAGEVVENHGIRFTNLPRTVADVLRGATEETGLAIADAALRQVAWDEATRSYDTARAFELRERIHSCLPPGGRGVRRARHVLELADGRAESTGESVSRLYLLELGFAPPRLQVPIPSPHGGIYHVDFGLDDAAAWGEYDGEGKYSDAAMRGEGVDGHQVLLAEKQREDWIRATTNRKFPRWGKAHTTSAAALGARLSAFSVSPPR